MKKQKGGGTKRLAKMGTAQANQYLAERSEGYEEAVEAWEKADDENLCCCVFKSEFPQSRERKANQL